MFIVVVLPRVSYHLSTRSPKAGAVDRLEFSSYIGPRPDARVWGSGSLPIRHHSPYYITSQCTRRNTSTYPSLSHYLQFRTGAHLSFIMSKSDFSQSLLASSSKPQTAAENIPIIARHAVSERARQTLNLVCTSIRLPFSRSSAHHPTYRSRSSSTKNASPPTRSFMLNWVKASSDGVHILQ